MGKQEAYTTKELSACFNVTPKTLLARAKREGWLSRPRTGRGGGNEWVALSIPAGTMANLEAVEKGEGALAVPTPFADVVVPDWSLAIALAKYRVVTQWREWVERAKRAGLSKAEASERFVLAVQSKTIFDDNTLETVGCGVTVPTLYRWNKLLKDFGDTPDALADRRGGWEQGPKEASLAEDVELNFLKLWLNDRKPTMRMAYRTLVDVMRGKGVAVPSYKTIVRFVHRFERYNHGVVVMAREGEKAWFDNCCPYISRDDSLLKVGEVLVADGHKCNFTMIHPNTGKACRFTLVGWLDWASRMPLGFDFALDENTEAISASLLTAIMQLGRVPDGVYIDNGKAFKNKFFDGCELEEMDGLYQRLGIQVFHSRPYNARAKIIERFWEDFDQQCARMMSSYSGNTIDNKPAHLRRNEKFMASLNEGAVPNIEEVMVIITGYCKWKASQPHPTMPDKTVWEVFCEGKDEGFSNADVAKMRKTFLHRKTKKVQRCRVTIAGIEFESSVLENIKGDVQVHYSLGDLSQVYLYDGDYYLGEAKPVTMLHPVAALGTGHDMELVREANKKQAQLRKATRALVQQVSSSEAPALLALTHMQPAAERRQDVGDYAVMTRHIPVLPQAPVREQENPDTAAENAQLQAMFEEIRDKQSNNAYSAPAFFRDALERYNWLFEHVELRNLPLAAPDALFVENFEAGPEWREFGGRYEKIRNLMKTA